VAPLLRWLFFKKSQRPRPSRANLRDEQIQQEVLAKLKHEPRVTPYEIGVVVKDGLVTLTGWVDS